MVGQSKLRSLVAASVLISCAITRPLLAQLDAHCPHPEKLRSLVQGQPYLEEAYRKAIPSQESQEAVRRSVQDYFHALEQKSCPLPEALSTLKSLREKIEQVRVRAGAVIGQDELEMGRRTHELIYKENSQNSGIIDKAIARIVFDRFHQRDLQARLQGQNPTDFLSWVGQQLHSGVNAESLFKKYPIPEELWPDVERALHRLESVAPQKESGHSAYAKVVKKLIRIASQDPTLSSFASVESKRVTDPVSGLYDSVPSSGSFVSGDLKIQASKGSATISSVKTGRRLGRVNRSVDRLQDTLRFDGAFLDSEANFVQDPSIVPLVAGRGVPTQALATMMVMKVNGIRYGSLKWAETNGIGNTRTGLDILAQPEVRQWTNAHPKQQIPAELLARVILRTHTGQYIETVLTQSGHRIVGVEITPSSSQELSEELSGYLEGGPDQIDPRALKALVQEQLPNGEIIPYPPDQPIPYGFRIRFKLAPL